MKTNVHLIVCLSLLLFGCSDDKYDDCRVFRYNESAGVTTLDPAHSRSLELMWVVDQMYDGLVELSPNLEIIPAIAESWEAKGRVYRFKIRQGVSFSSGRQVEARDVVYSLSRLLDPNVASSGGWILDAVEEGGIVALSHDVVEIRLKENFPPFLGLLSTTYASIIDSDFSDDLRSSDAGTGPFKLKWWVEDVALVMHKNERYWEIDNEGKSLPYLDAVHIDFVPDMGSEYLGLIQGRYDFISGLHPAYMQDLMDSDGGLAEKHNGYLELKRTPFLKTDYIGVLVDGDMENMKGSPLLDSRVRKALSMSIDRASIAKVLRRNAVLPSDHFVPPSMPGASNYSVPEYNVEEAKNLLAEAGFEGGHGLPELNLGTTADYVDLCSALQSNWQKIGINLIVDVAPSSVHRERVATSKIEMFQKSWLADYADVENFLGLFKSSNFSPGGPNYTHFKSEEFENLYNEAMLTNNDAIRFTKYSQMDSIIYSEMPIIPLFHDQVTHFVSTDVKDWIVSPVNRLDLRRVKLSCANAEN
ncbi:MAG: ABC transporter substrate-binding protein [Crocinitomicaceae bacterium]|nr:ABC transporter substrate-binding protein [Crocinitomicaceae bacterium]